MRQVTEYAPAKTVEYLSNIPQFSKLRVLIVSMWCENMFGCCSPWTLFVPQSSQFSESALKNVCFSIHIMSADKYLRIFSRQMRLLFIYPDTIKIIIDINEFEKVLSKLCSLAEYCLF